MPGQALRINVEDAARLLSQAYEIDFEVSKVIILIVNIFLKYKITI